MRTYHALLIHSPDDGHLHILAAEQGGANISLGPCFHVFWVEVELLDHMEILFFLIFLWKYSG